MHKTDLVRLLLATAEGGDGESGGSGGSGSGTTGGQSSGSGDGQGDGGTGNGNAGGRGGAGGGSGSASTDNGKSAGQNTKRKLEDLEPDELITLVRQHRGEAAENRTKRNEAESQITDLQRKVAEAFGIDTGDGTPDPEKLAADLAKAQDTARQRSVELAVYRAADSKDADPATLLDSRSFLDSVTDLDPNAQDFQTRLGDKIATWAKDNPRRTGGGSNTGGRPGGGIGQGGRGQQSGPTGVAAGRALHQERKGPQSGAA